MKTGRQHAFHNKGKEDGFTLIEGLIAIVILSVGLLGMAALAVGIINGNRFSKEVTTATTLAQEKMEDVRRLGYKGMTTNTTITENYNSIKDENNNLIADYAKYKRETKTELNTPAPGMKKITVTTYWDSDAHKVELKTILAQ